MTERRIVVVSEDGIYGIAGRCAGKPPVVLCADPFLSLYKQTPRAAYYKAPLKAPVGAFNQTFDPR